MIGDYPRLGKRLAIIGPLVFKVHHALETVNRHREVALMVPSKVLKILTFAWAKTYNLNYKKP